MNLTLEVLLDMLAETSALPCSARKSALISQLQREIEIAGQDYSQPARKLKRAA